MKKTRGTLKGKRWLLISMVSLMGFAVFSIALGQEAGTAPAVTPTGVDAANGESQPYPEEQNVASNMYMEYALPAVTEGAYAYEQEQADTVIYEKYYLMLNGEKRLLYSINFNKEGEGTWLGFLENDTDGTAITYTIYPLSDDEFAALTETERQNYFELMDGLGTVLTSICEADGFQDEKPLATAGKKSANLTYWTLELPNDMTWTESNENGEYQAIFYGTVQGQPVALYTVRIGDVQAQSVLGSYRVNGVEKTLSVESYGLSQHENWTDAEYLAAGEMMETINDVIQTIESSESFTAE